MMKRKMKIIFFILIAFCFVIGKSFSVHAESMIEGTSVRLCYSDCGKYMGGAVLGCDFTWVEHDFVTAGELTTYFESNPDYDYNCMFTNFNKTSTSNTSAEARCTYYASNNGCYEYGRLIVSCDVYGEVIDEGYCIIRECSD